MQRGQDPPTLTPDRGAEGVVVLVLASGRGERFRASGGTVHKLQALLGGRPVLARTLEAVRASGLAWRLEDAGHPGMGDSIAAAVQATRGAAGWLILPGDLPLVQPQTLRAVAAALADHAVVVPLVRGRRGHPVGFASVCGEALATLSGPGGAAPVLKGRDVHEMAVDDAGCVTDIDTLDDLRQAERLLADRGGADS
jgi:molybdenum cofactor cytidylyltransferase